MLTAEDLGKAGFTTVVEPNELPLPDEPRDNGPAEASRVPNSHESPGQAENDAHSEDMPPSDGCADLSGSHADATLAGDGVNNVHHQKPPSEVTVELGTDAGGTQVNWNVSTKGGPHAFILGIPGQGKSVTTRRIIREFAHQGLSSLILDFHGDMAADPPAGAQIVDAADGLRFSPFELPAGDSHGVNETAWEVSEIITYVCDLGDIQRNLVYEGLQQAYMTAKGVPTMAQFATAIEDAEREARVKR